ncbi:hypothetical protein L9F63_026894, partial [Diploptera punctata]
NSSAIINARDLSSVSLCRSQPLFPNMGPIYCQSEIIRKQIKDRLQSNLTFQTGPDFYKNMRKLEEYFQALYLKINKNRLSRKGPNKNKERYNLIFIYYRHIYIGSTDYIIKFYLSSTIIFSHEFWNMRSTTGDTSQT